MTQIKISVITVSYNSVDTIERAIDSVISQDYSEKEYIIIDGDSSDGTVEIIKKYDKQIAYWVSEPDKGIFDAMNKGIRKCSGDLIAFMNSDDWYANNNVLTNTAKLFEEKRFDVLCGAATLIYNDEIIAIRKPGKDPQRIWFDNQYVHQSMFCRKELFEKYNVFSTEYRLGGDYEWNLRMYCEGIKFETTDEIYSNYSLTGLSGTNSMELAEEFKTIVLKYVPFLKNEYSMKEILDFHDWRISFYKKVYELENKAKNKDMKLRQFFGNNEYYIWGTGKMGMLCYRLLQRLEVGICGFIDNNIVAEKIMGCTVYNPKQVDFSKGILISILNNPEDIVRQIGKNTSKCIVFKHLIDNFE